MEFEKQEYHIDLAVKELLKTGFWAEFVGRTEPEFKLTPVDGNVITWSASLFDEVLHPSFIQNIEEVLGTLEELTSITFTKVEADAQIDFTKSILFSQSGAEIAPGWDSVDITIGSAVGGATEYSDILHETLHALGLGHPGPYNGTAETFEDGDTGLYSAQSYNDSKYIHRTPGIMDLEIIWELYGQPNDINDGDTVHQIFSTSGFGVYQTIVDFSDGEYDVVDASKSAESQRIDLRDGAVSDVFGYEGNLIIASGSKIESAIGGFSQDTIIGNTFHNTMFGMLGDDVLSGGDGDDILDGGGGCDTLYGGSDNDYIIGGSGADTFCFSVDDGFDVIEDFEVGTDILAFSSEVDHNMFFLSDAEQGVTLYYSYLGSIQFLGVSIFELEDVLAGLEQAPAYDLEGTSGDDFLQITEDITSVNGGGGMDLIYDTTPFLDNVLTGGDGPDCFAFSNVDGFGTGNDTITDFDLAEGDWIQQEHSAFLGFDYDGNDTILRFDDGYGISTICVEDCSLSYDDISMNSFPYGPFILGDLPA